MLLLEDFNEFRDQCHNASRDAGWWKGSERYPLGRDTMEPTFTDAPRPDPDRLTIPTKLCLVHSEISEAYEGYMSGEDDQHLPALPNALVEFGDTVIRVADLAGYLEIDLTSAIALVLQADHLDVLTDGVQPWHSYNSGPAQVVFNRLQVFTSGAMESFRKGNRPDEIIPSMSGVAANLARIVILCKLICDKNDWNLMDAAQAKIAYNAVREDHKQETRALNGGKAF